MVKVWKITPIVVSFSSAKQNKTKQEVATELTEYVNHAYKTGKG
jgi:hypothetical protein